MSDPNLAIWLYIAIIASQILLSPTWGRVRNAIIHAADQKATEDIAAGNTQTSGAGDQTH